MNVIKYILFCNIYFGIYLCAVGCSKAAKGKTALKKTKGSKVKNSKDEDKNESAHISNRRKSGFHYVSPEGEMPPPYYDPTESGQHGVPLDVNVTIWIESVIDVDLSTMEYTVHAYLIMEWFDLRLAGIRNHSVVLRDRSLVFLPDPYCVNCRSPSLNANTNEFQLRINPNGFIYYSQSVTLSPTCRMNLRHFPFDWHRCTLEISSYAHNDSYIKMEWARETKITETELQQFTVTGNVKQGKQISSYISGNFTVMIITIEIKREQGFYVLQVYVPCIILVFMSWIIFFMSPEQIGDRLAIGVTLILTMIFLLGYVNGSLPKVSYIKAIDWYMIVALLLISASLVETVLVFWHWRLYAGNDGHEEAHDYESDSTMKESSEYDETSLYNNNHLSKPSHQIVSMNGDHIRLDITRNGSIGVDDSSSAPQSPNGRFLHPLDDSRKGSHFRRRLAAFSTLNLNDHIKKRFSKELKKPKASKKIDKISRYLFPCLFGLYNIGYFLEYMTSADFFNLENHA